MDKYVVEATLNGGAIQKGKWSPVYDQAMVVQLDSGKKFVTNFRYNLKNDDPLNTDYKKFANIKSGDYDKFDSKCDQTMIGHVLQDNTKNSMKNYEA